MEAKSKTNQVDLEKVAGEINEYRRQVTQLEMELESLRGTVSKTQLKQQSFCYYLNRHILFLRFLE